MRSLEFEIRAATVGDREAIVALLRNRWGGETMVVHDTVYRPADLPAFVAVDGPDLVGLVMYEPGPESWHVLSLDSLVSGQGIGGALLDRVESAARRWHSSHRARDDERQRRCLTVLSTTWLPYRLRRSRCRRPRAKDEADDPPDRLPRHPDPGRIDPGEGPRHLS